MFIIYLEIFIMWLMNFVVNEVLIFVLVSLIYFTLEVIVDVFVSEIDRWHKLEENIMKVSVVIFIVFSLLSSVLIPIEYSKTREFQSNLQEAKIKYGLENQYLVIKNKEGKVVFEKSGYFEYSKENNQVTIKDLVTQEMEVFTIEDDMELNVKMQ